MNDNNHNNNHNGIARSNQSLSSIKVPFFEIFPKESDNDNVCQNYNSNNTANKPIIYHNDHNNHNHNHNHHNNAIDQEPPHKRRRINSPMSFSQFQPALENGDGMVMNLPNQNPTTQPTNPPNPNFTTQMQTDSQMELIHYRLKQCAALKNRDGLMLDLQNQISTAQPVSQMEMIRYRFTQCRIQNRDGLMMNLQNLTSNLTLHDLDTTSNIDSESQGSMNTDCTSSNSTSLSLSSLSSSSTSSNSDYMSVRRNCDRLRKQRERSNETATQRQRRLQKDRNRKRSKRRKMSIEEKIIRNRAKQLAMQHNRGRGKYKNAGKFLMTEPGYFQDWTWDDAPTELLHLGEPDVECPHCGALLWARETQYAGKTVNEKFSLCCSKGKYKLQELKEPPKVLKDLYEDFSSEEGKYFHQHIRQLNAALSMAWLHCDQVKFKSGINVFKIHGQMHNKIPTVVPDNGKPEAFAQIYILDPHLQTERRANLNGISGKDGQYKEIAKKLLTKIQATLMECNGLIKLYRSAFDVAQTQVIPEVVIQLKHGMKNKPTRTYNPQTCMEIAGLIPIGGQPGYNKIGINVGFRTGGMKRMTETHALYEALQYPLLFPYATPSWPMNIRVQKNGMYILQSNFIYAYIF